MSAGSPDIGREFAEQRALQGWAQGGALDATAWQAAQALLGRRPSLPAWARFLDRLALYLGALLIGAGVICFIAFNWEDLGKFAKFYGTQALLVASTGGALWLGLERPAGRALLLLSGLLLGGLFALIGQVYQTGADTWQLFAVWAALLLPFALAGRWAPLWLLWVVVLNLAIYLYFETGSRWWAVRFWHAEAARWLVGALANAALLALWEGPGQSLASLRQRWGARLLLAAALVPATWGALWAIVDTHHGTGWTACLVLWALLSAGGFAFYRWHRLDLAALALLALGGIAVVTTAAGRLLFELDLDVLAWLILSGLVVAASVAVAVWLMALRRESAHD
jgi:uncharacterized membrane protein